MDDETLGKKFGLLIRQLRYSRGYSQEGFAQACGIDRAHMGVIERGDGYVTIRTALKLAEGLGMSLSGLFIELERNYDDLQ